MSDTGDEFGPILDGEGGSDYENYLRTVELLSLQKTPQESASPSCVRRPRGWTPGRRWSRPTCSPAPCCASTT
jgi:hypothetical protein